MALTLIPTPQDTPVGSDPGWVPGYVPSAVEWNDWWSRKVDVGDASLIGGPFLSLDGGQMTGPLYLLGTLPTVPEEAVNKAYVDSLTFASGPFMPLTGGNFTGPVVFGAKVTLAGNPVDALDPATKGYVDGSTGIANNALTVANAAVRRAGDTMTGLLTLSGDPANPMNAASKQYTDTKLALVGGTITGSLTVNGNIASGGSVFCAGNLYINQFNGWEWQMYVLTNGDHIQQYRGQWYDSWQSSSGVRSWVGGDIGLMNLDGGGTLNVKENVNAHNIHATDVIYADGTMGCKGNFGAVGSIYGAAFSMPGGFALYNDGTYQVTFRTTNWYEYWQVAGGHRGWVNNGREVMSLNPSGSLSVIENLSGNYLQSTTHIVAINGGVSALNGQMWMTAGGGGRIIQLAPNWYWDWNSTDGTHMWIRDGAAFWVMRVGDNFCYNNLGPVGGTYFSVQSDERAKTDITPARYGLSEIIALNPIEFTRINDGRKREVGFSAQQVRKVIPEAVNPFGAKLPDGTGGIDTDEPSLGIDAMPVIAALVNGMKELAAEIAALKAAR